MARAKSPVVIVSFEAPYKQRASQVAAALQATNIDVVLDDLSDDALWRDATHRRRVSEADLVLVFWPKTPDTRLSSRTRDALRAATLFVLRLVNFRELPIPLRDHRIPGDYAYTHETNLDASLTADALTGITGLVTRALASRKKTREHAVLSAIRGAVAFASKPTSSSYKERHWFRIRGEAWDRLVSFEKSAAMTPELLETYRDRMQNAADDVAAYDMWAEAVDSNVSGLASILAVLFLLASPLVARAFGIAAAVPLLPWLTAYLVGVGSTLALVVLPVAALEKATHTFDLSLEVTYVAFAWTVVIVGAVIALADRLPWSGPNVTVFQAGVLGAVTTTVYIVVFLALALSSILLRSQLEARRRSTLPEASVIVGLLDLMTMAARQAGRQPDTEIRSVLMTRIENLADAAERGLPRRLRTGDHASDVWLLSTTKGIAEAFRTLKKLVALPVAPQTSAPTRTWPDARRGSWEQLQETLSSAFVIALRGDWAGLPQAESPRITRPQRLLQIVRFFRTIFTALVPALVLWVIDRYHLVQISTEVHTWIFLGVLLWAVVSLLILVDPNVATKLTAMKSIRSTFDLSKGDSE